LPFVEARAQAALPAGPVGADGQSVCWTYTTTVYGSLHIAAVRRTSDVRRTLIFYMRVVGLS
jgi:hypothetical protein